MKRSRVEDMKIRAAVYNVVKDRYKGDLMADGFAVREGGEFTLKFRKHCILTKSKLDDIMELAKRISDTYLRIVAVGGRLCVSMERVYPENDLKRRVLREDCVDPFWKYLDLVDEKSKMVEAYQLWSNELELLESAKEFGSKSCIVADGNFVRIMEQNPSPLVFQNSGEYSARDRIAGGKA